MWEMFNKWFNRNKGYLATVFIISALTGIAVALLALFCPPVLAVFAGISVLGWTPLAFLSSLNVYLASVSLSSILTGCAFVVATGGAVVVKQLINIASHLYDLFTSKETVPHNLHPNLAEFIRAHLESGKSDELDDEEDYYDEFNGYDSSQSSMVEEPVTTPIMDVRDHDHTSNSGRSLTG
ncbi:hypothetical protein [Legionella waltersii]|uniref:Transmembrane protein n=1 Tax=Legionella waltersii TaxID=66969 RepID=A0A0W1A505_9GAMM|nr:hypothetical protein [Legionella waltersii]KTD76390.1 hypothetical protein Lwal_2112 [Legionella waltersii]SNV14136.1 Uncharacterised protein [Legionella waltersii]